MKHSEEIMSLLDDHQLFEYPLNRLCTELIDRSELEQMRQMRSLLWKQAS